MKKICDCGTTAATGSLLWPLLVFSVLSGAAETGKEPAGQIPPAATRQVDFAKDIQPIFAKSCVSCHGTEKQKGSYRLDSNAAALKGGETFTPRHQAR